MEISGIEKARIEAARLKNSCLKCILYNEEICTAPKLRFQICKSCYRISPKFAVRNLFNRIKALANQLFNLQGKPPGQFPHGK